MRTIDDAVEIERHLRTMARGPEFTTNLFFDPSAVGPLAHESPLHAIAANGIVLLTKKDEGFDRLYFAASGPEQLAASLHFLPPPASGEYIADLIGTPVDVDRLSAVFSQAGFAVYSQFQQMVRRLGEVAPSIAGAGAIRRAEGGEAAAIHHLLRLHFDPRAEHLPTTDDIACAAERGTILVSESYGEIAALLYYDVNGLTTTLRYWLVLESFRRLGYGDGLLCEYFSQCRKCRRFSLWVRDGNRPALRHYLHYGYQPDGAIDRIMRRQTPA